MAAPWTESGRRRLNPAVVHCVDHDEGNHPGPMSSLVSGRWRTDCREEPRASSLTDQHFQSETEELFESCHVPSRPPASCKLAVGEVVIQPPAMLEFSWLAECAVSMCLAIPVNASQRNIDLV